MGWWHAKFSIDVNTFTVLFSCPQQGSVGCTGRKSPHRLAAFCPFRPLRRELAVWCKAILVRLRLQDGFKEYVIHGVITVMGNFLPLSETKNSIELSNWHFGDNRRKKRWMQEFSHWKLSAKQWVKLCKPKFIMRNWEAGSLTFRFFNWKSSF